jgi:hypothetical protein
MLPSRCIILGSGNSVADGFPLGLSNYLEREVTFGLNESIKFFDTTAVTFMDWCCYRDRFDLYSQHPLTIGCFDTHIGNHIEGATPCPKHDSLTLLPWSGKWNDNPLKNGLYAANLCGGFTLHLAISLGFKQIFLLGFDCCEVNGKTHWYQGIEGAGVFNDYEGKVRTGVGKKETGEYNSSIWNNPDDSINALWKPFEEELYKVMVYNVSLMSRIETFKKIGYQSMITILNQNKIKVNQEEVQKEIREILQPFNKLDK